MDGHKLRDKILAAMETAEKDPAAFLADVEAAIASLPPGPRKEKLEAKLTVLQKRHETGSLSSADVLVLMSA